MTKKETTKPLRENIDYTVGKDGNYIFSRTFLLTRGYCCQSGCTNCPYDYSSKVDPNIPAELQNPWGTDEQESAEQYVYDDDDINE